MKKLTLILSVVALLFSCNNIETQVLNNGIEIYYPADWEIVLNNNTDFFVVSPGISNSANVDLIALSGNKAPITTTFDDAIDNLINNIYKNIDHNISENSETEINDKSCSLYVIEAPAMGSYSLFYFFNINNNLFTIQISTNQEDYKNNKKEIDKIIQSIKITE